MGGLIGYEIFPGMLRGLKEFGGYPGSDHLDVLLQTQFEFEVVLLKHL